MLDYLIAELIALARAEGHDAKVEDFGPHYASLIISGVDVQIEATEKKVDLIAFDWAYDDHQLLRRPTKRAQEIATGGLALILAFRDELLADPII